MTDTIVVHKSQGSEYSAVMIPLSTQHYLMLQHNLRYTTIAWDGHLVIPIGQKKVVAMAARNVSGKRQWSKLRKWMQ